MHKALNLNVSVRFLLILRNGNLFPWPLKNIFIGTHRSIFANFLSCHIRHSCYDLSINVLKVYFSLSSMEIEYNAGVTEIISKDTTERVYIADVALIHI